MKLMNNRVSELPPTMSSASAILCELDIIVAASCDGINLFYGKRCWINRGKILGPILQTLSQSRFWKIYFYQSSSNTLLKPRYVLFVNP